MPVPRQLLGRQHSAGHLLARLLTGGGADVEVAQEYLRIASRRSAALLVVVGLDIDGGGHRSDRFTESRSFAVGAGDAVALGLRSLDDELQVGDIAGDVCQLEGHRRAREDHGRIGRSLNTRERRHSGHDAATTVHDPVVQPHEEVAAADLTLGTQHRAALGGAGSGVPGQDLGICQALPSLTQLLEHGLHGRLIARAGAAAVAAVADVLTALDLRCGHALGGARHLFESDRRNVLHSLKRLRLNKRFITKNMIISSIAIKHTPPVLIFSVCQGVRSFSTLTSSLTILSRNIRPSRYTISFWIFTGSLTGFVSSE